MDTEETILLVDSDDRPLAPGLRSAAVLQMSWRRTSGGVVVDDGLKWVLCHRRALTKDERPGLWVATFGGKSKAGEEPLATAKRELNEEFGLDLDSTSLLHRGKYRSDDRRQFEHLYVVKVDRIMYTIVPDRNEVDDFAWIPIHEVLEKIGNDPLWYNYGYERFLLE